MENNQKIELYKKLLKELLVEDTDSGNIHCDKIVPVIDPHTSRLDHLSLAQYARTLEGLNSNKIKSDLCELGYLDHDGHGYRVIPCYKNTYFMERETTDPHRFEIYALSRGREVIVHHYNHNELTLKKTQ